MDRLKTILLDFLEANIKKMFYGCILAGVITVLIYLKQVEQAIALLIALGGFCISQFKFNTTNKKEQ